MRLKGRYWVALWLGVVLAVAVAVISRQRAAVEVAARLRRLRVQQTTLQATRAELEAEANRLASRAVLVPVAERRLGLREPADTEIVRVAPPVPAAAPAPADTTP